MKFKTKIVLVMCFIFSIVILLPIVAINGVEGLNRPVLPDHDLHYNYGTIKEISGIWYKTTYFGFEDDSQSISVYYGSDLFDYSVDNIKEGDFVIVVWKWVNTPAETFAGYITVPWLIQLIESNDVVFPWIR